MPYCEFHLQGTADAVIEAALHARRGIQKRKGVPIPVVR